MAREDRLDGPAERARPLAVDDPERLGERLHAGEEQLLQPACLDGHLLLQALLVAAVLEHEPPLLVVRQDRSQRVVHVGLADHHRDAARLHRSFQSLCNGCLRQAEFPNRPS